MKLFFLLLSIVCSTALTAQQSVDVYPSNWWVNMKMNKIQLMVQGKNINTKSRPMASCSYPGLKVISTEKAESPDYLFVNIEVSPQAKPGIATIRFTQAGELTSLPFELKQRRPGRGTTFAQGVQPKDLVYLLMPDRFSNGDPSNDRIPGMRDQSLNRDSIFMRHGGDMQGVIKHLDYLQDLGVTTVWMMPVLENDMPDRSEHGYAFTNHYRIDRRLGGPSAYLALSDSLHARGMKLIQDAVYNHVGSFHHTVVDKPFKDWLHEWPRFTQTSYKDQVLFDPHAAPSQQKVMSDGWFVRSMPDLNQSNPYVAKFLIQHAIWSVEMFGVDGWRIDTYAYNDLGFMNKCNQALIDEYPKITMFGETWVHGVINQSYFCQNNLNIPFRSNLQNTTDFQMLFYGITPALNENFGWTEGVNKLYTTAAQDIMYKHPETEVIFLDNHDLSRFYSVINQDIDKYKIALNWLMTFRGIPQMYYGMEHLMTGYSNPDGNVRLDFKGGWDKDSANKFTAAGRTDKENEIFNYIRTLARFRKTSPALTTGKMMQYLPVDGLYVYFRYVPGQTIMCIMNTSDKPAKVDFANYPERISTTSRGKNIVDGTVLSTGFEIPAKKMWTLEMLN